MTVLYITQKAWRQIDKEVQRLPMKETGGVLMGFSPNDRDHVITFASGPGPRAVHEAHAVLFDDRYLKRLIRRKSFGGLTYMGDWHSHTVKRLSPSKVDKITMYQKTVESIYASASPIMLIAGINKSGQVHARAFTLEKNSIHEVQKIVLLNRSTLLQLEQMLASPYDAQ